MWGFPIKTVDCEFDKKNVNIKNMHTYGAIQPRVIKWNCSYEFIMNMQYKGSNYTKIYYLLPLATLQHDDILPKRKWDANTGKRHLTWSIAGMIRLNFGTNWNKIERKTKIFTRISLFHWSNGIFQVHKFARNKSLQIGQNKSNFRGWKMSIRCDNCYCAHCDSLKSDVSWRERNSSHF